MSKKLQVFISSTYDDLQEERQSAVEAVLKAGHIPAGMELFKSADETQKDTITKWIRESDVYLLILGGRYGTIEPQSAKSYTHWEYDYAEEIGSPRFAVVITETALTKKVKKMGQSVIERDNYEKYKDFKEQVLSKTSHFYDDIKDIKLTIMQTLNNLSKEDKLSGWVSGKEIDNIDKLQTNLMDFVNENRLLKIENRRLSNLLMEKEKVKKKEQTFVLNQQVDFEEQVDKILELLGALHLRSSSAIEWETDGDDGNTEKHIILPKPPSDFKAYFIYEPTSDTIDKLLIVSIATDDDSFDLQARLGDIRILIMQYREAEGVPINFVLAIPGDHGKLQERVNEFLQKAISKESVIDKDIYQIQIWDDNVIKHFEDELGLTITL
jgi:regulator of replication initiation timing